MTTFYRLKENGTILDYTEIEKVYDEEGNVTNVPAFIRELYTETERKIIQLVDGSFAFEDTVDLDEEVKRKAEKEFNEAKQAKLNEVDAWTAKKITGGLVSSCYNNESVLYDTDEETQLTMTKARTNCESERFTIAFPDGMGVRGYVKVGEEDGKDIFADTKTILFFSPAQIIAWDEDFSLHLAKCKGEGWAKQAEVNACTTIDEINAIILE